eukprot:gene322-9981_t
MGVKHLWSIIQPACKKEPFESMRGKVLCVDLSTWICQAEETLPLKHAVHKPYLRNTIFRVICLKRLGTRLIFVTEGKPPEIKWNAILERAAARAELERGAGNFAAKSYGKGKTKGRQASGETASGKQVMPPKKIGRSVFQRKINECAQLLRFLGIPVVQSEGEAEACCAFLDNNQLADGCITQDGDTFLYGGKVVYRNLGITNKEPFVYKYSTSDVKRNLGIDREQMVALALLLGCDYCDGVPGVGSKTALKLLDDLRYTNIIESKAMKVANFPNEEVIKEFLNPRDNFEEVKSQIKWEYPDLVNVQRFCAKHMEWPEEYTLSKVLGVATNEHLSRISRGIPLQCPFSANRLVKPRTKHGVPLFEVEWTVTSASELADLWKGYPNEFSTLESQQEILLCLPDLVNEFEKLKLEKKSKGKKTGKKNQKSKPKDGSDEESTTSAAKSIKNAESTGETCLNSVRPEFVDGCNISPTNCSYSVVSDDAQATKQDITEIRSNNFLKKKMESMVEASPEIMTGDIKIEDLMGSFSLMELSSITLDGVDSNEQGKLSMDQDRFDAQETLTPDYRQPEILPLRERLQRRAMANIDNRLSSHKCNGDLRVTSAALADQLSSSTAHEATSMDANTVEGRSKSPRDIDVARGSDHLKPIDVDSFQTNRFSNKSTKEPNRANFSSVSVESDDCVAKIDFQGFQEDKERSLVCHDTVLLYCTSLDEDCLEQVLSRVNSPLSIACNSSADPKMFQATPDLLLGNILTPKHTNFPTYDLGNLTNDSLGCLLENSPCLFGSPYEAENKENSIATVTTPGSEEYTYALRRRLGILPHDTPERLDCNTQYSPQSEGVDRRRTILPPSLLERLKKRSHRI